jgi:hypothetical protein
MIQKLQSENRELEKRVRELESESEGYRSPARGGAANSWDIGARAARGALHSRAGIAIRGRLEGAAVTAKEVRAAGGRARAAATMRTRGARTGGTQDTFRQGGEDLRGLGQGPITAGVVLAAGDLVTMTSLFVLAHRVLWGLAGLAPRPGARTGVPTASRPMPDWRLEKA